MKKMMLIATLMMAAQAASAKTYCAVMGESQSQPGQYDRPLVQREVLVTNPKNDLLYDIGTGDAVYISRNDDGNLSILIANPVQQTYSEVAYGNGKTLVLISNARKLSIGCAEL